MAESTVAIPRTCPNLSQKILKNRTCISPSFVQKETSQNFGLLRLCVSSTHVNISEFPCFLAKLNRCQLRFPVALPIFTVHVPVIQRFSQKVGITGYGEPKSQHHRTSQTKWQMGLRQEVAASDQIHFQGRGPAGQVLPPLVSRHEGWRRALAFDLANALAGDCERPANLLQRVVRAVLQTKAPVQCRTLRESARLPGVVGRRRLSSIPTAPTS
jgi:hypothetical protein